MIDKKAVVRKISFSWINGDRKRGRHGLPIGAAVIGQPGHVTAVKYSTRKIRILVVVN